MIKKGIMLKGKQQQWGGGFFTPKFQSKSSGKTAKRAVRNQQVLQVLAR